MSDEKGECVTCGQECDDNEDYHCDDCGELFCTEDPCSVVVMDELLCRKCGDEREEYDE